MRLNFDYFPDCSIEDKDTLKICATPESVNEAGGSLVHTVDAKGIFLDSVFSFTSALRLTAERIRALFHTPGSDDELTMKFMSRLP